MTVAGIALVSLLIGLLEAPPLWKRRQWRELGAFTALLFIAAGLSISVAVRAPLPNPVDGLIAVFSPIYRWVHSL